MSQTRSTPAADPAAAHRAARRDVQTGRLFGVDFVPVRRAGAGGAPEVSTPPAEAMTREEKIRALADLRARYERESPLVREMPGWTNIVFGVGDPEARLMFVGEAPGADEDRLGEPFVGRAGQKLNDMIRAMGLTRAQVYIANVLKVRPPENRTPTLDEMTKDGPYLTEQVRIIRPEVIVTLGKPAAQWLLGITEGITRVRGRWMEFEGIPALPTYHPAYLLRQYTPEVRKQVWTDLQTVMARLGLPVPPRGNAQP
jgi:DNA polymerase